MERKLSSQGKINLLARYRKERDKPVFNRIKAVLAYDDGYNYSEVAKILLLDDEAIRRHISDYFEKNKLAAEKGGSESYLSESEFIKLTEHIRSKTYLHVKDICIYVKNTFNKIYSISGLTKWLHANKFCYKKPHAAPAKADKEAQSKFIKSYKKLKAKAGKDEPIYFIDSVYPQHQKHLASGWILKGERKEMPTTGRQKRLNFMGGICLNGHRIEYQEAEKINADSIALFLSKIRKANPGKCKIHVIWDNAGYHRIEEIQVFSKNLAIQLHYFPPYSLNPIERLWKIMHEQVTYKKYYEKFSDFSQATLSRITDNFQILNSTSLVS